MCGIAGFTRASSRVPEGLGQEVTACLVHRGPDQQGVYETPEISLCAVRLKVIDLGGGDQPMRSDDGDLVVVFNGEIYNHGEVRRELEARGHRFHSQCDTEVMLHAFLEWDADCFARLRGMFAVALWSDSRKRLVLARDRLGIKPLYFFRNGRDLYFGSELKAILAHQKVPRRLNLEALQYYLSLNYVPSPHTLIEGIEKLLPGHWLEWWKGETRQQCWWRLRLEPRGDWTLETAKEELDSLLESSVREHLAADVPLGIWASGGVDSSTVLHYASHSSRRLNTFSVSFRGRSFDETPYFREIARVYGTEHHEFDLGPDEQLPDTIEEFAFYSDEPSADAGALPVWFLSRLSAQHVTVALSGEGADELFGGYETYVADRLWSLAQLAPAGLRRAALAAVDRFWPVSDEKIGLRYRVQRGLEGSLLPADEAHFYWNGAFSREQKKRICPGSNGHNLQALVDRLASRGIEGRGVNRYMLVDQHYYLPDDILYKVDRISMAHSLEVRPPFLDHRIAEFAASLPENLKIRRFRRKYLLKELMRGKLPAQILDRKKTGFDIPAHDWFRGVLRDLLHDTVTPQAIDSTGIFDKQAIQVLIRDHMERRINIGYHLWGLLTLFLWMRRWKVEVSTAEGELAVPVRVLATN